MRSVQAKLGWRLAAPHPITCKYSSTLHWQGKSSCHTAHSCACVSAFSLSLSLIPTPLTHTLRNKLYMACIDNSVCKHESWEHNRKPLGHWGAPEGCGMRCKISLLCWRSILSIWEPKFEAWTHAKLSWERSPLMIFKLFRYKHTVHGTVHVCVLSRESSWH